MPVKIVEAASSEPIDYATAKAHLRLHDDDEKSLVEMLIAVAREEAEHLTGLQLMSATLEAYFDCFPRCVELPRAPVTEVVSIKYIDRAGVLQTVDTAVYVEDIVSEPARILPDVGQSWPLVKDVPNAVTIQFKAGFANSEAVPAPIKQWMLLRIGTLYENRESVVVGVKPETTPFVDRLLDRYKVWTV